MSRRPRVDMAGHYHVVNRGVERRIVYKEDEDYERFLELLCEGCQLYSVKLHGYVLMNNHYHLLIETTAENLSAFMKHINAMYAIYFNRKYQRFGHLWQGRFKSWYVTDEAYLYALASYIENNPIKAKIVKRLGEYKYSSYRSFIEETDPVTCLQDSFIFERFATGQERIEFFESAEYEHLLDEIKKASNLVVTNMKADKPDPKRLQAMFATVSDRDERNKNIIQAYRAGYSQHAIAECLGLSQPQINRIIRKMREHGG